MIDDAFYMVGAFLAIGIIVAVMVFASATVKTVTDSIPGQGTEGNATVSRLMSRLPGMWDNIGATLIVGLMLVSLVVLYFLQTHPGVLILIVLTVAIVVIAAGAAGEAWASFKEGPLGASAATAAKTSFLLDHYAIVTLVYLMLALVVFFAKPQPQGGY